MTTRLNQPATKQELDQLRSDLIERMDLQDAARKTQIETLQATMNLRFDAQDRKIDAIMAHLGIVLSE